MRHPDRIVLETFSNRGSAELMVGLLRAEGVDARVEVDDAGGFYPMLQFTGGVKVVVSRHDEMRAREILADLAQP